MIEIAVALALAAQSPAEPPGTLARASMCMQIRTELSLAKVDREVTMALTAGTMGGMEMVRPDLRPAIVLSSPRAEHEPVEWTVIRAQADAQKRADNIRALLDPVCHDAWN